MFQRILNYGQNPSVSTSSCKIIKNETFFSHPENFVHSFATRQFICLFSRTWLVVCVHPGPNWSFIPLRSSRETHKNSRKHALRNPSHRGFAPSRLGRQLSPGRRRWRSWRWAWDWATWCAFGGRCGWSFSYHPRWFWGRLGWRCIWRFRHEIGGIRLLLNANSHVVARQWGGSLEVWSWRRRHHQRVHKVLVARRNLLRQLVRLPRRSPPSPSLGLRQLLLSARQWRHGRRRWGRGRRWGDEVLGSNDVAQMADHEQEVDWEGSLNNSQYENGDSRVGR